MLDNRTCGSTMRLSPRS